mmetsp:Transcript_108766/g.234168  ORF Transcript_108766/g.234168 Transcript_108766/m.234168 type:complete len:1435 (+) Transcript_108766:116-4420(+)
MAPHSRARALLGLCGLAAAGATWIPRSFHEYPSSPAPVGSEEGVRRYSHEEAHSFEDGSDLAISWEADVNPETIMSLDLEHHTGARMLECRRNKLVMQVPTERAQHAHKWRHVTAGRKIHGCEHKAKDSLYHRIVRVAQVAAHSPFQMSGAYGEAPKAAKPMSIIHLETEEIAGPQMMFPHFKYFVHVMPSAAKEEEELARGPRYPLRREGGAAPGRRLGGFTDWVSMPNMSKMLDKIIDPLSNVSLSKYVHYGMDIEPTTPDAANGSAGIFSKHATGRPQVTRYSWSWDWQANTTSNPQFMYTFPGGKDYMRLSNPAFKGDFGFSINLTSQMLDFRKPPHVQIDGLVQGSATIRADLDTQINFFTDESGVDVSVPRIIGELDRESWSQTVNQDPNLQDLGLTQEEMDALTSGDLMEPLSFMVGGVEVTVKPKADCRLEFYHIGKLKGSLRMGLDTKLLLQARMHFDTEHGLHTNVSTKAMNVTFTPPTWMLFTRAFELGVKLEPTLMLEGGFGTHQNMEIGVDFRPYVNVSIHQEGVPRDSWEALEELIIYPFRAIGLPQGKAYKVEVSFQGINKTTPVELSSGVIEYDREVDSFSFGWVSQKTLLNQNISVRILEVAEDSGVTTEVASGITTCAAEVNGLCTPTPLVTTDVEGNLVTVQLATAWGDNAPNMMKTQVKSVSLATDSVIISSPAIRTMLESQNARDTMVLVFNRNGRTYHIPVVEDQGTYFSEIILEMGPSFLQTWEQSIDLDDHSRSLVESHVSLIVNGQIAATGTMPSVAWDHDVQISGFGEGAGNDDVQRVPVEVDLRNTDGSSAAMVSFKLEIRHPSKSAFWVNPLEDRSVPARDPYTFRWVAEGQEGWDYNFTLVIFKVMDSGAIVPTPWDNQVTVGCEISSINPGGRFTAGVSPCVFSWDAQLPEDLIGENLLLLATWEDSSFHMHDMLSVPFHVVAPTGLTRRRLAEYDLQSGDAYAQQAQAEVAAMKARCSSKPLMYSFGAGMYMRVLLRNVETAFLEGSSPGTISEEPDWKSQPVQMFNVGNNESKFLREVLPRIACTGGACDGMMPICDLHEVNPIDIKQIVFRTSRNFKWADDPNIAPQLRFAVAYGLALAPEAISLGEKEILGETETSTTVTGTETTTMTTTSEPVIQYQRETTRRRRTTTLEPTTLAPTTTTPAPTTTTLAPTPAPTAAPTPAPAVPVVAATPSADATAAAADFNDGAPYQGAAAATRRLAGSESRLPKGWSITKRSDEVCEECGQEFNKFTVTVTKPMHYKLDEDVMRLFMLRNDIRISDGREETEGPIHIKDWELRESPRQSQKGRRKAQQGVGAFNYKQTARHGRKWAPEVKAEVLRGASELPQMERHRGVVSMGVIVCASIGAVGLVLAAVSGGRAAARRSGVVPLGLSPTAGAARANRYTSLAEEGPGVPCSPESA